MTHTDSSLMGYLIFSCEWMRAGYFKQQNGLALGNANTSHRLASKLTLIPHVP